MTHSLGLDLVPLGEVFFLLTVLMVGTLLTLLMDLMLTGGSLSRSSRPTILNLVKTI